MLTQMANLQRLGRALMLPIAVLPAAGVLLRLGQPDLLDIAFVAEAGAALFANLGLLFAIGVAIGLARNNDGAAGLAGTVCFLVTNAGAMIFLSVPETILSADSDAMNSLLADQYKDQALSRLSVPIGIVSGIVSALLYNRYSTIRLPDYLAFFGGKRFVPIAAACAGMIMAVSIGLGIDLLIAAVSWLSEQILKAGSAGLFIYGVLNRLLIVTGLHHILNNIAWFVVGDFNGVGGDLNRFFAGDPEAGGFMAGFFPIMMFGLPAACYAMYRSASPEKRKIVGGMLGSMALTSFLTGVTEPIEFTFMFLAPILYLIHALLTGISMGLMDALGVKLGFGFSAGLFDYFINFNAATKPLLLLPVGMAYAIVYYSIFSFVIRVFNLKTPGREVGADNTDAKILPGQNTGEAVNFIAALGGADNLSLVSACMTRLRLEVLDQGKVDDTELKALGAKGVIRPSETTLQVVIGPRAELISEEINTLIENDANLNTPQTSNVETLAIEHISEPVIKALGGMNNILSVRRVGTRRLFVNLHHVEELSKEACKICGLHLFERESNRTCHLHMVMADPATILTGIKHR